MPNYSVHYEPGVDKGKAPDPLDRILYVFTVADVDILFETRLENAETKEEKQKLEAQRHQLFQDEKFLDDCAEALSFCMGDNWDEALNGVVSKYIKDEIALREDEFKHTKNAVERYSTPEQG